MESASFAIRFDLEEHGVAQLTLQSLKASETVRVSYIGQGLTEFAHAVLAVVADGQDNRRVIWAAEPDPAWIMDVTTDRLRGPDSKVTVRVVESYGLGSVSKTDGGRVVGAPPDAVVLDVALAEETLVRRAVEVLSDTSRDGGRRYEQVWRQPFPREELAALRDLMARRGWPEDVPRPRAEMPRPPGRARGVPVGPTRNTTALPDPEAVPDGKYNNRCGWGTTEATVVAVYCTSAGQPVNLRCGNIHTWGYRFVNAHRGDGWDARFEAQVVDAIKHGQRSADGSRLTFRHADIVVDVETSRMADGAPCGILTAYVDAAP